MVMASEFELQELLAAVLGVDGEVPGLKVVPHVALCRLISQWAQSNFHDSGDR